jgi:CubicO group peptidase (beta-lactamase class C family)
VSFLGNAAELSYVRQYNRIVQRSIEGDETDFPLHGTYDDAFRPVVDAFIENYAVEAEVGSAVSIVVDGETVVDVWGGWADRARSREWERDTIVCMMSVAKGVTGIAFNKLIERGVVDPDAPVATYWPEFAQNGKEGVLVRHILDHTAGLPVLHTDRLWPGAVNDRDVMVAALERESPLWEPGTVAAYHVHTQGWLLGEIMRRTDGRLVGPFVADEVAGPLGADYRIGLPESEFGRITDLIPNDGLRLMQSKESVAPEDELRTMAFQQNPAGSFSDWLNSTAFRTTELPSGSGHGNARGIAQIYGAVGAGELRGVRLLSEASIDRMTTLQHYQYERLQDRHYRQGLGILLNSPEAVYMGPHPEAFGHHGIGGSIGFADRAEKLGFGYSVNQMHAVGTNGPRAARLIDATFASL